MAGADGFLRVFAAIARGLQHDARTPLNTLRINAELVRRSARKVEDAEMAARLGDLASAIDRDIGRIQDALDGLFGFLAPPAAGERERPLDAAALVRLAAALVAPAMRRRRIAFRAEVEGDGAAPIEGPRGPLVQATVALLAEAAVRGAPGDEASLIARSGPNGRTSIEVRLRGRAEEAAGRADGEGSLVDVARALAAGCAEIEERTGDDGPAADGATRLAVALVPAAGERANREVARGLTCRTCTRRKRT